MSTELLKTHANSNASVQNVEQNINDQVATLFEEYAATEYFLVGQTILMIAKQGDQIIQNVDALN